MAFKLFNESNETKKIRFIKTASSSVNALDLAGAVVETDESIEICLEAPALTCVGAVSKSGFITFEGSFDIYINDMLEPKFKDVQAKDLKELDNKFLMAVDFNDTIPSISIKCAGEPLSGEVEIDGVFDFYINDTLVYKNVTPEDLVVWLARDYPDLKVEILD